MEIRQVAIIGAGPLGRTLAYLSARAGYATVLEDVLPSNLRTAQQHAEAQAIGVNPAHLRYAETIEEAVRHADIVLDTVPDELESKLELVTLIDRMAPPATIIATPSRALSIGDLASCTYRAERCVALELPEPLTLDLGTIDTAGQSLAITLPITITEQTLPEVATAVTNFCAALGFHPTTRLDTWQPV